MAQMICTINDVKADVSFFAVNNRSANRGLVGKRSGGIDFSSGTPVVLEGNARTLRAKQPVAEIVPAGFKSALTKGTIVAIECENVVPSGDYADAKSLRITGVYDSLQAAYNANPSLLDQTGSNSTIAEAPVVESVPFN